MARKGTVWHIVISPGLPHAGSTRSVIVTGTTTPCEARSCHCSRLAPSHPAFSVPCARRQVPELGRRRAGTVDRPARTRPVSFISGRCEGAGAEGEAGNLTVADVLPRGWIAVESRVRSHHVHSRGRYSS